MVQAKRFGAAAAALSILLPIAACQTVGTPDPEISATGAIGAADTPLEAAQQGGPQGIQQAAQPAALPGTCSAPRIQLAGGPPPPPEAITDFAGGVASNVGRNVTRNLATAGAQHVLGQIPGIGGVIAIASAQTAAKETIRTAEDVRGNWTATDGAPTCGCRVELSRSGMFIATNDVKAEGCATPVLARAAQWRLEKTGIMKEDLVLVAGDGASVLARLDRKGINYFQGPVGGVTVTMWR